MVQSFNSEDLKNENPLEPLLINPIASCIINYILMYIALTRRHTVFLGVETFTKCNIIGNCS